jgi:hypothetical protein
MGKTSAPAVAERPASLEPMHRLSEVLVGLIMVPTFTGPSGVASTGPGVGTGGWPPLAAASPGGRPTR